MAKPQRLSQYFGPLNPNDAAIGIQSARLNALSLMEVAEKLFNCKKYALSTALSILAIEEASKTLIVISILLSDNSKERQKLWKQYRTHTAKGQIYTYAISSVVYGLHPQGDNKKLLKLVRDKTPQPKILEFTKQLMFYSDCFTGKIWTVPEDQASVEEAKFMLDDARAIILNIRKYTPEELAIWKRHLYGLAHISPQETINSLKILHEELLHKKFIKPGWWKRILKNFGLEENSPNK